MTTQAFFATPEDCSRAFYEAFAQADVDAALAASVFHAGTLHIPVLKRELAAAGFAIRPPDPEPADAAA